jgi:hypothetical protein
MLNNFNKNFSDMGIAVVRSEIKSECNAVLTKLDESEVSTYSWLVEWMNKVT